MAYHSLQINVRDDQRDMEEATLDKIRRYKANNKHLKTMFDALVELINKGEQAAGK